MKHRVRICLEERGVIYKITSIYLLRDGSFKVDMPYFPYKEGLVIKFAPNYGTFRSAISEGELKQTLSATNRPQLSIHASGFAQFSGPGILSGIDGKTKYAKGVGIYSAPLSDPVRSGPTFGITFWGLHNFEKVSKLENSDLVITQSDVVNRYVEGDPAYNTYMFEGFIFPEVFSSIIVHKGHREQITFRWQHYVHSPGAIFTLPVIRLFNHTSFIGILPSRVYTGIAEKEESGFNFGGPGGVDHPDMKKPLHTIIAFSSMMIFETDEKLDFPGSE